MALSQIDLKIRALVEGFSDVAGASDQLGGLGDQADNTHDQLQELSDGTDKLIGNMKKLAVAFVSFLAIKGAKELADFAARTETLGVTLGIVAENAGYSKESIAGYESELKKMGITTQAARDSLTKMIQAGLPLEPLAEGAATNVSKLARASQDLAVVTGENSSETFERLITNIQQMDTMGLRFMGITLDLESAYESFAQSNDLVAASLTKSQKVLATNEAVLREAAKLAGAYGAAMETTGKKVASLARYQGALTQSMGDKLLPAYGQLVDELTYVLSNMEKMITASDATKAGQEALADAVGDVSKALGEGVLFITEFITSNAELFASIGANILGFARDLLDLGLALAGAVEATGNWDAALWGLAFIVAGLRDGFRLLGASFSSFVSIVMGGLALILQGWANIIGVFGENPISDLLSEQAEKIRGIAEASKEYSDGVVADFAAGRTAVKQFVDGVEDARVSLRDFGKAKTFGAMVDELELLKQAQDDASLSAKDLKTAEEGVAKQLQSLTDSGKLTAKQLFALRKTGRELGISMSSDYELLAEGAEEFNKEVFDTKKYLEELGSTQTLGALKKDLEGLISNQRAGKLSALELSAAHKKMAEAVEIFGKNADAALDYSILLKYLGKVANDLQTQFNEAMTAVGKSTSELETGLEASFATIVSAMEVLAGSALTTAEALTEAFSIQVDNSKTLTELHSLLDVLTVTRDRAQDLIDTGNLEEGVRWLQATGEELQLLVGKFDSAFKASLGAAQTADQFARLTAEVKAFGEEAGKSAEWVESRMARIDVAVERNAQSIRDADIAGALAEIGISAEEMRAQASHAIEDVVLSLGELRAAAILTADEYYRAFSEAVDMSDTLADLRLFRTELEDALRAGQVGWAEYESAVQKVEIKFEELFESQLKSANTREDFEQLRLELEAMGKEGAISGELISQAFRDINEEMNGTKEILLGYSEDLISFAQAHLDVIKAQNEEESAILSLKEAKNKLLEAEIAFSRDNSEQNRILLDLAQKNTAEMEARVELAESILELKQEEEALNLAAAELREAEAEFERDRTEANRAAVAMAEDEVFQRTLAVNEAELLKLEMEEVVEETAAAANEAEHMANELGGAGDAANNVSQISNDVNTSMSAVALTTESVAAMFEEAGLSAGAAAGAAAQFVTAGESITLFGETNLRIYEDVQAAVELTRQGIASATQSQSEMEAQAQAVTNQYQAIVAQTTAIGEGTAYWANSANLVTQAYNEVRQAATDAAEAASSAVRSFLNTSLGIHNELLEAQGKEAEAVRNLFDTREADLNLQYAQLEIQIQIARVQAEAAGVSTANLDRLAAEAEAAFNQAVADLAELERIQLEDLANVRAAEVENEQAALAAILKEQQAIKDKTENQEEFNALLMEEEAIRARLADAQHDYNLATQEAAAHASAYSQATNATANALQGNAATLSHLATSTSISGSGFSAGGPSLSPNFGTVVIESDNGSTEVITDDTEALLGVLGGSRSSSSVGGGFG